MKHIRLIGILALFLILLWPVTGHCSSTDASSSPAVPIEEWITNQLFTTGGFVDLNDYSGNTGSKISGQFLQSLFTNDLIPARSISISNATVTGTVDLSCAEIRYPVRLLNCVFKGPVLLNGTHCKDTFSLKNSTFEDKVVLNGLQVERNFNLSGAVFKTDVDADELKVGGWMNITAVRFDGACSLRYAQIANEITQSDADGMRHAVFLNGLNLYGIRVGGDTHFEFARVHGVTKFDTAQIKGKLFLNQAAFDGEVSLFGTQIGADINLSDADFASNFNADELKLGGSADITAAKFDAGCSIRYAQIVDEISQLSPSQTHRAVFKNGLNLYGTKVAGDVHLELAIIETGTNYVGISFGTAQIGGKLFLNNANIQATSDKPADFTDASVQFIDFKGFDWPHAPDAFLLDGLSFTGVYAGTNDEDAVGTWNYLQPNLEQHAQYSSDFYQKLENFFQNDGKPSLADSVHIVHCQIEGNRNFRKDEYDSYLKYVWNVLSDFLLGYGRETERPFILSVIVVLFGLFVFRPKNMSPRKLEKITFEPRDSKTEEYRPGLLHTQRAGVPPYNSFLYSLDVFIPLIDLRQHDSWEPEDHHTFAHYWVQIQRILGWILVPLWLAAVSGLVGGGH